MSSAGPVARAGRVAFEVSRFEVVGDCCRVEGQWFGVRGRRFMRPALTVAVDGRRIRLLADLADKPWAAQDGESWTAMFPYALERARPDTAELTVAPDVTVTLPPPAGRAGAAPKETGARGLDPPPRGSRPAAASSQRSLVEALMAELNELRDTQRRLRRELDDAELDNANAAQRLEEVTRELRAVKHEREESDAARDRVAAELEAVQEQQDETVVERNTAVHERDTALGDRDRMAADREVAQRTHDQALRASGAAAAARDHAVSEREAALAAQQQASSERNAAIVTRDRAVTERDDALSVRDHAVAERDAAAAARDAALTDRDATSRTVEELRSELADLVAAQGAALVMRRAAQAPAASRRRVRITPGLLTVVVVLAILVAWVLLLRGV